MNMLGVWWLCDKIVYLSHVFQNYECVVFFVFYKYNTDTIDA